MLLSEHRPHALSIWLLLGQDFFIADFVVVTPPQIIHRALWQLQIFGEELTLRRFASSNSAIGVVQHYATFLPVRKAIADELNPLTINHTASTISCKAKGKCIML